MIGQRRDKIVILALADHRAEFGKFMRFAQQQPRHPHGRRPGEFEQQRNAERSQISFRFGRIAPLRQRKSLQPVSEAGTKQGCLVFMPEIERPLRHACRLRDRVHGDGAIALNDELLAGDL